jgi:hypothetical protein
MDVEIFRNEYDGKLAELGFVLKEVNSSNLVYKKYPKDSHIADPSPDYILTISFNNENIKDIKLIKYKYYLVDEYTPKTSKHTYHFKSMDDLLAEVS